MKAWFLVTSEGAQGIAERLGAFCTSLVLSRLVCPGSELLLPQAAALAQGSSLHSGQLRLLT